MSKFLDILEQHDPVNQSKIDAGFQAIFFLNEQEVSFSSKDYKGSKIIILNAEQGDIFLKVIGMKARQVVDSEEENQEIDVEAGVERLANKPILKLDIGGPSALSILKARILRKQRAKTDVKGLDIFKKNTEELEKAIQNAKTRTYTVT